MAGWRVVKASLGPPKLFGAKNIAPRPPRWLANRARVGVATSLPEFDASDEVRRLYKYVAG